MKCIVSLLFENTVQFGISFKDSIDFFKIYFFSQGDPSQMYSIPFLKRKMPFVESQSLALE